MGFPEFDPCKKKLLFFSRGRGRGHAIPDLAIARELERLRDDVEVRFVSYATGARTIEELGYPLIDIDLPEMNGTAETTVLAGKLIAWLRPDLVIAHEEFAALPAAKIFDVPAVFLTDWFTDPAKFSMQSLRFADGILFLGRRGSFSEPEWVRGKVRYVGPAVRRFEYARKDRGRARDELDLPDDGTVIAVLPGSWTESAAPILEPVLAAFSRLPARSKHLVWLAGDDQELIQRRTRSRSDVTVLKTDWRVDRLMAAADLAITKGSRGTSAELESLGIRSLAISHGLNPMDDRRVEPLPAAGLTGAKLLRAISDKLAQPAPRPKPANGAAKAARLIADRIAGCNYHRGYEQSRI